MLVSPADGLLPWLEKYTFPTERQFSDPLHAQEVARFFIDELLRCSTTTAMVYCSVHPESVEAFFAEGAEADFIVLDLAATPLLERRTSRTESLEELLFVLALLGDDRAVLATYAAGCLVHSRLNGG